ncbi:hypothetical protein [Vagococcus carniphilus]|uniref:hypothetical protein n=1 Tax=Vagococcus carniphilus TaxID=218144 RepID=UPI00288EAA62|nr:hypothetical protein [Vagococcus carniphilus]MDT2864672.1 hypothetical protein [Vagococcus carniphilus]
MFKNLFKKKNKEKTPYIKVRSNVIQFDEMGYPLRLIINWENEQIWIDTTECEGDVILEWRY